MPARRAVSPKGMAKALLLEMAMMPATTEYALQARASRSAKLPICAIMILPVCRAVASRIRVLLLRTHPTGRLRGELAHCARCRIGDAVGLLRVDFVVI